MRTESSFSPRHVALGALIVGALASVAAPTVNAQGSPQQLAASGAFVRIAREVTPAVVSIESQFAPEVAARMQAQEQGIPEGMVPPQMRQRGPARATGSGFLVTQDGYILTNNHVVENAQRVNVTLLDRRIFTARVIGHDPNTDVALIKIDGASFPTVQLGDDSTLAVGAPVLAIGNPLGLDFTVTSGIVSAKGRGGQLAQLFEHSDQAIVDFIQTDAVINPGNSGGPLIDMDGRVVGITSAIESPTGVYAGYGFAIPIGIARIVMNDFRQYGRVRRAILGVTITDVTPNDARAAGLNEIRGALVGGFSGASSPAQRAGLQPGDIILAVDNHPIDRVSGLQRIVFGYQPGQTVGVTVQRYGAQRSFQLTLGEAASDRQVASANGSVESGSRPASQRLGITVQPLTQDIAGQLQLPNDVRGIIVSNVDPNGPSAGLLGRGDVIVATLGAGGQHAVQATPDLQSAIGSASSGVVSLLVYSPQARGTRVVNVPLSR